MESSSEASNAPLQQLKYSHKFLIPPIINLRVPLINLLCFHQTQYNAIITAGDLHHFVGHFGSDTVVVELSIPLHDKIVANCTKRAKPMIPNEEFRNDAQKQCFNYAKNS